MADSILRCEKCGNNKFIIYKHDSDKLIIECANCGNRVTLEENMNIKNIIHIFETNGSLEELKSLILKWYGIRQIGNNLEL